MHHTSSPSNGTRPIVIDVRGEPVGVVITHDQGYRFMAVKLEAFGVDGEIYATLEAAREAVGAAVQAA